MAPFRRDDDPDRVPDEMRVRGADGLVRRCVHQGCERRAGGRIPPASATPRDSGR